jgi:radical SAM protein with 4Fe4S-binding SPASM domain
LIDKKIVTIQYESMGDVGPCAGGKFVAAIYPDGDVSFCDSLGAFKKYFLLGNINTHFLEKIWYSSLADKLRYLPQYSECKEFYTCFGGCPLNSYALWRTFQKADPLCAKIYKTPPSGEIYDWKGRCQRIDA